MKLFLLSLLVLVSLSIPVHSDQYGAVFTSYSEVAAGVPILVSTVPTEMIAVRIDSQAANGMIVFYRSTGTVFDATLATQTKVNCSSINVPIIALLFEVKNASSTFLQVIGNCFRTIYFTRPSWPGYDEGNTRGFGLPQTGKKDTGTFP